MSLSASSTITVYDSGTESATATETVQPPAAFGTGGRGVLYHATLYPAGYAYPNTPDETENVEIVATIPPLLLVSPTLGGASATKWSGTLKGLRVIERWIAGDTGGLLDHAGALWQIFAAQDELDQDNDEFVQWAPDYALGATYNVIIVDVRIGGASAYKVGRRLASLGDGYALQPVEIEYRIVSLAG